MHYTLFEGKKLENAMSLHKEIDDNSDHKRQVRKMLEERLERKRLKEELEDELDGEFDWDELDRE